MINRLCSSKQNCTLSCSGYDNPDRDAPPSDGSVFLCAADRWPSSAIGRP